MDHDFPDFGFKGTTKPTFNSSPILEPNYDDVFGGLPKYPNKSTPFNFDSVLKDSNSKGKPSSNLPVFDKPLYDNDDDGGGGDIFDGVPGLKTKNGPSSSVKFENNVFSSSSAFDDLLGSLGKKEMSASGRKKWGEVDNTNGSAFDDLLPGFGANSPPQDRVTPGTTQPQQSSVASSLSSSTSVENPFVVLESASVPAYESPSIFAESLEQIDKDSKSSSRKVDISSVQGHIFDTEPIVNMAKSEPIFSSGSNFREKDANGLGTSPYGTHKSTVREPSGEPSTSSENASRRKVSFDDFQKSHQSRFSIPNVPLDSHHAFTQNGSHANSSSETNSDTGVSPKSDDNLEAADDIWLTVSEITLTTLPTRVPPPSRPAPPRPQQNFRDAKGFSFANIKKPDDFSPFYPSSQSYGRPRAVPDTVKSPGVSSIDGLADFTMARPQSDVNGRVGDTSNQEDTENSSAAASAAAMKEAVERAEAKFKHAREVRERENAAKNSGIQQEREEKVMREFNERDFREKQERLDHEQEQRERDEKDREQRRIEKEREQAREIEMQRETGRQAVDRAMKEVRERAAADARQKAQRAAVDKVNAEARERAERAAVQRAQAEARERAAKDARLRAEKAAAEAKERKNAEDNEKTAAAASAQEDARIRAGRASVNRATAEARERAAAAAASAAAAAAAATRGNQRKSENDLDSFFNSSARPDSAPRPRTSFSDSAFDAHIHNRAGPEGVQRSSSATSAGVRKESSTTNIGDDLTSFFGSTPPSGDSRESVGESDERRRARLERDQRTQKRAEKALAEKNERDRHTQWEQAERQRIAGSLDFEIKRWSAGKEGNLRAMLSTLQYVLWPECGWQPVSLTDLITSASVKKVYRKATLCIHPDKVQQKGASLQQKYIAEKVFDMLKEAWNKLNSEELF